MLVKTKKIWFTLFLLYFAVVAAAPASAYLDPGTGSTIIQIAVASLLGAAFAVKTFWRRITGIFSRKKPSPEQGD